MPFRVSRRRLFGLRHPQFCSVSHRLHRRGGQHCVQSACSVASFTRQSLLQSLCGVSLQKLQKRKKNNVCARPVKSTLAALSLHPHWLSQPDVTPAAQRNTGALTPAALLRRPACAATGRPGCHKHAASTPGERAHPA